MKLNSKIGTLVAIGALAAAVPAAAHPGGNSHAKSHVKGSSPSQSHRCRPHNRAYIESGTVDATTPSTLAQNSDGTWSGTLVVDVTRADRAARSDKGQTVTYTFSSANLNVAFDGSSTGFSAGERVKLIGKLAESPKRCTSASNDATPVFKRLAVHPASSSSSESGSGSSDS